MVSSRAVTAVVGLVLSLAVSAVVYYYTGWLVAFLVVPIVPLLLGRRSRPPVRECPVCGFRTSDTGYEFCPRDGTRLE